MKRGPRICALWLFWLPGCPIQEDFVGRVVSEDGFSTEDASTATSYDQADASVSDSGACDHEETLNELGFHALHWLNLQETCTIPTAWAAPAPSPFDFWNRTELTKEQRFVRWALAPNGQLLPPWYPTQDAFVLYPPHCTYVADELAIILAYACGQPVPEDRETTRLVAFIFDDL